MRVKRADGPGLDLAVVIERNVDEPTFAGRSGAVPEFCNPQFVSALAAESEPEFECVEE